jgi:hypothetical protein
VVSSVRLSVILFGALTILLLTPPEPDPDPDPVLVTNEPPDTPLPIAIDANTGAGDASGVAIIGKDAGNDGADGGNEDDEDETTSVDVGVVEGVGVSIVR